MASMSVIDPFTPLKSTALAALADDVPWTQTLRFTEQVAMVLSSGFAVEDLQYLLRHQIADPAGKYQQDPDVLMQVCKGAGYRHPCDPIPNRSTRRSHYVYR